MTYLTVHSQQNDNLHMLYSTNFTTVSSVTVEKAAQQESFLLVASFLAAVQFLPLKAHLQWQKCDVTTKGVIVPTFSGNFYVVAKFRY